MKKLRMTQEQFDNWINAMESGDYRFGKSRLYGNGCDGTATYCALGVLCAINDIPLNDSPNEDAYMILESLFKFDYDGEHLSEDSIIIINDNSFNNSYQLVIDYLKNYVEIYN